MKSSGVFGTMDIRGVSDSNGGFGIGHYQDNFIGEKKKSFASTKTNFMIKDSTQASSRKEGG